MKHKWNVDPSDPITILRLISELEGVWGFLDCLGEEEDLAYIEGMKKKYYPMYFKMKKNVSSTTH